MGSLVTASVLVFIGAGVGGVLRLLVGLGSVVLLGPAFPWGTMAINALGSCLIGVLSRTLPFNADGTHALRFLLMTGVMGGFTTYSSFSLEAASLWTRGDLALALAYVAGTLALCLGGVAVGLGLGRWIAA